jgi:hypothetical protein
MPLQNLNDLISQLKKRFDEILLERKELLNSFAVSYLYESKIE